jgi:hypothetical protein
VEEVEEIMAEYTDLIQSGVDFKLPENWYREVARTTTHHLFGWDNEQEKIRVKGYVDSFLDGIVNDVKITLSPTDREALIYQILRLYSQHKLYPYVQHNLFKDYQNQGERFFKKYPNFSKIYLTHLAELERKSGFQWYENMKYVVGNLIFIYWGDLLRQLEERRRKVKVLVASINGPTHANTIKDFIHLRHNHSVEVTAWQKTLLSNLNFPDFSSFEMVVSTTRHELFPKDKLFIVDNIPSIEQMAVIGAEISRLQDQTKEKADWHI